MDRDEIVEKMTQRKEANDRWRAERLAAGASEDELDEIEYQRARLANAPSRIRGDYLLRLDYDIELEGHGYTLAIHLGQQGAPTYRVVCVGVELLGFRWQPGMPATHREAKEFLAAENPPSLPVDAHLRHTVPITSTLMRQIPLGHYVDKAIAEASSLLERIANDPEVSAPDRREAQRMDASARKPPGRRPRLTDRERQEFVVGPYRRGGSNRTEQVRLALLKSRRFGDQVTTRQAKSQVEIARRKGLL